MPGTMNTVFLNLSNFKLWRPSHRHYKHWRSHPSEKVLLPSTFKLHNQKTIGAMLNNLLRSEHVRGREIRLQIDTCRKEMEGLSSWSCVFARTARSKNIDEYRTLRKFDLLKLSISPLPPLKTVKESNHGPIMPEVLRRIALCWDAPNLAAIEVALWTNQGKLQLPWAKTRVDSWDKTRPKTPKL